MNAHRVILIVAGLCLAGCFPYHYTLRPGISRSVVDSQSHTPIAEAAVVVHTHIRFSEIRDVRLAPDSDGIFCLPPSLQWGVYVVPMDVFFPWSEVTIEAPGYEKKDLHLRASAMGPSKFDLGEIRMSRFDLGSVN